MLVGSKVLGKVGNALGKHCNLETGGTGVLLINLEVVDVDIAHCLVSLVSGLIFRGCGKSTLRGAVMIPACKKDARLYLSKNAEKYTINDKISTNNPIYCI